MVQVKGAYDIDAVRHEWIGRKSEVTAGRYPVEYDPIRRHCHMVEDTNPLFLDPEFAARTRFGGVIAPPVLTDSFAGRGVWPPVAERPHLMQLDPRAVWIVTESRTTNQDGELVATTRNTILTHRTPEEIAAAGDG